MPSHDQGIHTCFLAAGSWCLTISWGLTGECESHPTPVRVTPAGWYPAHSTPPQSSTPGSGQCRTSPRGSVACDWLCLDSVVTILLANALFVP